MVVTRECNLKAGKTVPPAWMKDKAALVISDVPDKDKFLIINPEEIGKWEAGDRTLSISLHEVEIMLYS